jgi:hypothetical protein
MSGAPFSNRITQFFGVDNKAQGARIQGASRVMQNVILEW